MRIYLITLLFLTTLFSCKTAQNKQLDEGKIKGETYYNREIGWTMQIPEGWNITHKDVSEKRTKKALNAINETAGKDYDVSKLKRLLNFQKNKYHVFQSTSEPFENEYEGKWEESIKSVKKLIYKTYVNNRMKIDTTSSKEKIDNLEFDVFHITIDGPDGEVFNDVYRKQIKGYDFAASLIYRNEKEKNELMKAWKNSKFE